VYDTFWTGVTLQSFTQGKGSSVQAGIRVPTHPGKSWIFPWIYQALESPGKSIWSWKVLKMKA